MSATLPWISADEVFARVSFGAAVRAIQAALRDGFDPAADFERSVLDVDKGQVLLMPSESPEFFGIKVASVAPGNPELGKERIQGVYLLLDSETLSPTALLDGTALTTLRTPAVSAAAADLLAPPTIKRTVVFGSGPQAFGHIEALRSIRELGAVAVVARNAERAEAFAGRLRETGLVASVGNSADVRDAQLIVCTTTARTPLFDGSLVPDDSCTIAVGSHEPDARELDSALIGRAQVVVEDIGTALREGGDVIIPIGEGVIEAGSLVPMRGILTGDVAVDRSRPRVFKSSGMPWEDLVVAEEVLRASAS